MTQLQYSGRIHGDGIVIKGKRGGPDKLWLYGGIQGRQTSQYVFREGRRWKVETGPRLQVKLL